MKFTLILATLGRSDEVRRMLESLKRQSYQDFEVVLIDQNSDNRVFKLYKEYCDYRVENTGSLEEVVNKIAKVVNR